MPRGNKSPGYSNEAGEVKYRSTNNTSTFDRRGFELFDQLPAEIQVIIISYIPTIAKLQDLSLVSKLWRELVIQCPIEVLPLADMLPKDARVNKSWIGRECRISQLNLPPSYRQSLDFIKLIKSVNTVTDPTSVMGSPRFSGKGKKRIMAAEHVENFRCGAIQSLQEGFANLFPNLQVLATSRCSKMLNYVPNLANLRKIFIASADYSSGRDAWLGFITVCKNSAPKLEEMYLPYPKPTTLVKVIELRRKATALGIRLVIDLFDLLLVDKLDELATQFKANDKPYSFYRYGTATLFGRAVACRNFKAAKYFIQNGYTTVLAEIGTYNFPKKFDQSFDACTFDEPFISHPFILDESMTDENFMTYLLEKGFDVNWTINGRTLFECYSTLNNDVVKFMISKADVDFSMRTLTGKTLFHLMAEDNAYTLFEIAFQRFADPDDFRDLLHTPDDEGTMPIHIIFSTRTSDSMFNMLLPLSLDLDVKDKKGQNIYSLVARRSNKAEVSRFIDAGYVIEDKKWILTLFNAVASSEELINLMNTLAAQGIEFADKIQDFMLKNRFLTPAVLNALTAYEYDIYAPLPGNKTLLFSAVLSTDRETQNQLPNLLSEFQFDVNHMDSDGYTPLLRVILNWTGPEAKIAVKALLDAGANPNLAGVGVSHSLILARHNPAIISLLQMHKADINLQVVDARHAIMTTPFMEMMTTSQTVFKEWKSLKDLGGNLTDKDSHNNTLLHITQGFFEELASAYSDINIENVHGETPLFTRYRPTEYDLMLQFDRGANVAHVSKAGLTPLHNALLTNNQKLVKALLENHVAEIDLSLLDNMGRSVGHLINSDLSFKYIYNAVLKKSTEEKKKIIQAFNSVDKFGNTSIHSAIKSLSFTNFGKFVTGFRLNVNPATSRSPLSVAISEMPRISTGYARLLLELGASVTCRDSDGNTPLHILCSKYPNGDILIPLLLKAGASVSVKNNQGSAPIDMLPTIEAYLKPKFYSAAARTSNDQVELEDIDL